MCCGRVKGKKVPEDTPKDTNASRGVEDGSPAKVSNQKPAEWIGQSNADAEP